MFSPYNFVEWARAYLRNGCHLPRYVSNRFVGGQEPTLHAEELMIRFCLSFLVPWCLCGEHFFGVWW
jgi:hypothetical protein